jgi:hypothetical protein
MATKKKGDSTTAAGQALGFGMQYTRMTHLLLTSSEGSIVGFEVLDDVHVEHSDGIRILEQSKSSLTGNPLSNQSADLWKSLANWVEILECNSFDLNKLRLVIYSSNHNVGEVVNLFANAKTLETSKVEFVKVKNKFLLNSDDSKGAKYRAGEKTSFYMHRFFDKPDVAQLMIRAFEFSCSIETPENDLIKSFSQILPEKQYAVAFHMCGWVKNRVDELIRNRMDACISHEEFFIEMHSFNRKYTERAILKSLARDPTDTEKDSLQTQLFVRQLEIVDLTFEDRLEAIRQYFKSAWDRTQWSKDGVVHADSFDELDDELRSTWKNIKRVVDIEQSDKESALRGQLLLYKCLDHKAKLENCEAPNHFIPGCFHLLADGPSLNIGWHPEYVSKLKK